MRPIWSGTARSSTRTNRATGQPEEYRLVVFDTGEATCTCPAHFFAGSRLNLTPEQRMRYRCKHLEQAFKSGSFELPRGELGAVQPAPDRPPTGAPAPSRPGTLPEQPDLFDDDDDEYIEPLVRR